MSKKKLTPCSVHNTEKLELWLDKMASEGFLLDNEGYKITYAKFKEAEPEKAFHRIWPKDSFNEFSDAKNRRRDFGWEFVASSFDYDIFRAYDEKALLIDYDNENIKYINKSSKKRIVFQILQMALPLIGLLFLILFSPYIIVALPTGIFSCFVLIMISFLEFIKFIKNIIMIQKLKSRTETQINEDSVDWKKETVKHQLPNIIYISILLIFLIIIAHGKYSDPVSESLPDDKSSVPFATVIDFTDNKESYTENKSIFNVYQKWETPFSEINYDWQESAEIITDDGNIVSCILFVDYHETVHPLLSEATARLYVLSQRLSANDFISYGECPSFGYNYETMFYKKIGEPSYVFQDGCKIIHFHLDYSSDWQDENEKNEFNNKCIKTVAESIKD